MGHLWFWLNGNLDRFHQMTNQSCVIIFFNPLVTAQPPLPTAAWSWPANSLACLFVTSSSLVPLSLLCSLLHVTCIKPLFPSPTVPLTCLHTHLFYADNEMNLLHCLLRFHSGAMEQPSIVGWVYQRGTYIYWHIQRPFYMNPFNSIELLRLLCLFCVFGEYSCWLC